MQMEIIIPDFEIFPMGENFATHDFIMLISIGEFPIGISKNFTN